MRKTFRARARPSTVLHSPACQTSLENQMPQILLHQTGEVGHVDVPLDGLRVRARVRYAFVSAFVEGNSIAPSLQKALKIPIRLASGLRAQKAVPYSRKPALIGAENGTDKNLPHFVCRIT